MMNWLKKYGKPALIGLGVFIALVAAGVLLYAKISLTPEAIEATLSRSVQVQLQRRLACREIEFGLFQGIRLRGVSIGKSLPGEIDDLFTCDELAIEAGFWPLLFKKLVIRGLTITNPRLNLQTAGSQPFSIYGKDRPAAGVQPPALELVFLPGSIMLSGGTLAFVDRQENFGIQFSNVRLDAKTISYLLPFSFTASAGIGQNMTPDIQLKGHGFFPSREFSAELAVPEFDLARFRPFFALFGIPLYQGTGRIKLTAKTLEDSPAELAGTLSVEDAQLLLLAPQKPDDGIRLERATAELTFQAAYEQMTGNTDIQKLSGRICGSPFQGSGFLRGRDSRLELHLTADRFSLDKLSSKLFYGSESPFLGLRLSGSLGLALDMSPRGGGSQFPIITVKLRNNRIIYPGLGSLQPELSGTLTFDSRAITLTNVRIGTKNLGIVLAGSLGNYLLWPPQADLRVVSSDFNFYDIFTAPEDQQGENIGPFDFGGLKFDGPIELGDVPFMNLNLSAVQGSYVFENNLFSIRNFRGGIKQGGSFMLDADLDLAVKGFAYNLKLSFEDIPVKPLAYLAGFNLSSFLDGDVTGSASVSASGTKSTTFSRSLAGDASLHINNCRMQQFFLPDQLNRFINLAALNKLQFTDADIQLKLRGTDLEVSGAFLSPQAELYPRGQIGLDGELEMQAELRLAADIFSTETRVAEYLPRDGSWVVLPVVLKGTLDNPDIALSEEAIQHIMQVTLPRLFMDMIEKSRAQNAESKPGLKPGPKPEPEPDFAPEPEPDFAPEPEFVPDAEPDFQPEP